MDIFNYLQLYFIILFLILAGYYLIPAGFSYLFFYVWKKEKWAERHIQNRYPSRKSILREVKWSLISISILSFFTLLLYMIVQQGYSNMYYSISEYGWVYFVASCLFAIVIYDTYYYWIHRFMHLKKVFPIVHKIHHLSHTPSPWAILAFSPLETIFEFAIYPILIFTIPLHPAAIGFFIFYNILLNTGGHIGFEIIPRSFFHHRLLKYGLTVTHHDMHHSKINYNYGIYFNFWDRLMKTNHPDYEKTFNEVNAESKT